MAQIPGPALVPTAVQLMFLWFLFSDLNTGKNFAPVVFARKFRFTFHPPKGNLSMLKTLHAVLAAALIVPAFAFAQAPVKTTDGALTDGKGMTLYTFDKDAGGKSVCNGSCAANWPPLMAGADAKASGDYSIVTRDDGSKQWAYKSKPLYIWVKDQKPGDKTGDGVGGTWHTAKP